MTNLITLAKQSGASTYTNRHYPDRAFVSFESESLQAFSDLIAQREREACAVLASQTVCNTHIPTGIKIYGNLAAKAIKERTS